MNVPNAISLARLAAVPLVVLLVVRESYGWALIAFVVAGASDAVDGFLARILDQRTAVGALLDPAADKLLLATVFGALWWVERLPGWLFGLVVGRDLVLSGAYWSVYAAGRRLPVRPTVLGKLTTAVQLVLVGWLLWLASRTADPAAPPFAPGWLVAVVAVVTVASGLQYCWTGYRQIRCGLKQG